MKITSKLNLNSKLLPILVILAGTLFFFISDPPQSPCGAQIEAYKKSLKGKLYSYKIDRNIIPSAIKRSSDFCRQGKSLGSCIDYFEIINSMMNNLNQLDSECFSELLNEKEFIDLKNLIETNNENNDLIHDRFDELNELKYFEEIQRNFLNDLQIEEDENRQK